MNKQILVTRNQFKLQCACGTELKDLNQTTCDNCVKAFYADLTREQRTVYSHFDGRKFKREVLENL
jgi:hypothetical protein